MPTIDGRVPSGDANVNDFRPDAILARHTLPDRLFVRCLACELGTLGRAFSRAFTIGARFL
jgi:hypothetical protein